MGEILEAALRYAARGWPVLPCEGKIPLIPGGVHGASCDPARIREWWTRWPSANIALSPAPAGLMVLDFDPGFDLLGLIGKTGPLEATLCSKTPRGGEHLFYRTPDGLPVPSSTSKLAQAIDVKSTGGYVLLPPSRTEHGVYQWGEDAPVAPAPPALLAAARAVSARPERPAPETEITLDLEHNIQRARLWLAEEAEPAIEGQGGNARTYAAAAYLHGLGVSEGTACDLLEEIYNPRCEPPWDFEELEQICRNAYRYHTSPAGNLTPEYRTGGLLTPLPERPMATEKRAGKFRVYTSSELDAIPEPSWLIRDALPSGAFGILYGGFGTYKTFVALSMGLSIATGGRAELDPWRGQIEQEGKVLFMAGEGLSGLRRRVRAWEQYMLGGERTDNFVLIHPILSVLEAGQDGAEFIEAAQSRAPEGYKLIILDTVGKAMRGMNENHQEDASRFTKMVDDLRVAFPGSALLAIHHSGHGNPDRERGSSVFGADADTRFRAEKTDKQTVELHNTKQKDAPEWESPRLFDLRLVQIGLDQASLVAVAGQKKAEGGKDNTVLAELIDAAARKIFEKNPSRRWTLRHLSVAISLEEGVAIPEKTIRSKYIPALREQEGTAIRRYFDPAASASAGQWCFMNDRNK